MYTKEELESMDVSQLMGIASELGLKVKQDDDLGSVVYAILDKAAEESAAPKRKRTRILKKDTSHVYSVNGDEGENFDTASRKKKKTETPSLFADLPQNDTAVETPAAEEPAPEPKKRKRKTKAEKEAEEAQQAAQAAEGNTPAEEPAANESADAPESESSVPETEFDVPEAEFAKDSGSDAEEEEQKNLLQQLQEKMAQRTREDEEPEPVEEEQPDEDQVWEDDPADGTDFITVIDIPVEDQAAIPSLDIFDRPTASNNDEFVPASQKKANDDKFDFTDIISGNGVLEVLQDGYGFLRSSDYNYLSSPDDIYISQQQIKQYGLKTGDVVDCMVRPPYDNEKYFALTTVNSINGRKPSEVRDRVAFEHLTPLFPDEKFTLCGDSATTNPSVRVVDLFSPIGKGQRALIVAQPKTGKTVLMKDIANAIAANHPEAYIMMLLIDERPDRKSVV